MPKTKTNPPRSEVKTEHTWDLSPLCKSDDAWEKSFKKLEKMIPKFEEFKGRLGESPQVLRDCFDFEIEFEKLAERLGSYAFLKSSEDVSNSTYQGMVARFTYLATRAGEAASFIAPEIRSIPKKRMNEILESPEIAPYKFQLEKLLRYRPHILSEKEERLLAMQGEIAGTARKVFGQLTDADMTFGHVTNDEGEKIELTQGSFRTLLESPKRPVRKRAFQQFNKEFEEHANTLSATLSGSVLQDVYHARARNYPSALEAALFADRVPVSVYTNLVDTVHEHMDTVYRYLELRRQALRVKELHGYDNYVPLVKDIKMKTPYEEAVTLISDAVAPLGQGYRSTLQHGLQDRWVDRYENKGKRSGAFSAGGFTGPPYMLMNFRDESIDSVFTLAHEAGHSMHTHYSARNQPFQYYNYTIFVAEVASTFNEQLLNHHLLQQVEDDRKRAYLINREIDEIRGTIIRQTMFAEFEKIIHEIAEAGEPLTLERFREEYRNLLELYFGPDFIIDDALSLEGLRIPHFYSAFYVYKYATGLSAAIALSQGVLQGGNEELDRYLTFLKSGGSKFPLDLLRDAGVDMESPEPVHAAMNHFKALVDELEDLL